MSDASVDGGSFSGKRAPDVPRNDDGDTTSDRNDERSLPTEALDEDISRLTIKSRSKGKPDGSKSFTKFDGWQDCQRRFFQSIGNYWRRVFSFPLVREPIAFSRPGDFTESGEHDPSQNKEKASKFTPEEVEDLCNYDKATKDLFELILLERKEIMDAKDKYHYQEVDLAKFPGWTDVMVERLKSTFQVFDVTGDGLIDFEEMSSVLTEFGDKTPEDIRKKHFDAVDIDKSGAIDFEEFITMTYDLTMREEGGDVDIETTQLGDSYRMIDRNMSRIRSLDVVQQLQAGLF